MIKKSLSFFLQILRSIDDCKSFLMDRYHNPNVTESDFIEIEFFYGDLMLYRSLHTFQFLIPLPDEDD